MKQESKSYYDQSLELLSAAGLSSDVTKIVRNTYRFECTCNSQHCLLFGTVTALEISEEGGIELKISSPSFGNDAIRGLYWDGDRLTWFLKTAKLSDVGPVYESIPGEFYLFYR